MSLTAIVEVVSASAAAIAAVASIIGALLGRHNKERIAEVNVLVNGSAAVQGARIDQLTQALIAAGVPVPDTTQKTGRP